MNPVLQPYTDRLTQLKAENQLRQFKAVDTRKGKYIIYKGRECLNLTANDYLGLAVDESLCSDFYQGLAHSDLINDYGLGASSSRLLTGNSTLYEQLEQKLCEWYDMASALLFNSGYHANTGMIPALAGENDLIFSDSLNHASIIDGIRLSRARCIVFEHNDLEDLEAKLKKHRSGGENALIITESVFSMDGDLSDIKALTDLKNRHNALLYVDEAHSAGIYGDAGQGWCHQAGVHQEVDILLGTMGKALASHGAYAMTSAGLKAYLINSARSLIFSTALPPVTVSWNLFLLDRMAGFREKRALLQKTSTAFRQALELNDLKIAGASHIIPVITGSNQSAVRISRILADAGFLAFPIRPPSVPKNQARIRFSITSDITMQDLAPVADLIRKHLAQI